MGEAALWGLAGASSLLIGAAIGIRVPISDRTIGLILGFGAGTLISALAFELTEEAFALGGADAVAVGLALGAFAYYVGDREIQRRGGGQRMDRRGEQNPEAATALLFGAVLDGIPESVVIGITLLAGEGVGVPVLAAVFISNMPEAISSAKGMQKAGARPEHIMRRWLLVVVASGIAAGVGFGALDGASGNTIGLIDAFAAGAVLTMLADTMIPEAHKGAKGAVGLVTVLGFALAYLLSTLE